MFTIAANALTPTLADGTYIYWGGGLGTILIIVIIVVLLRR